MGSSRGGREKDFADARYKRRGCSAGPTTLMVLMSDEGDVGVMDDLSDALSAIWSHYRSVQMTNFELYSFLWLFWTTVSF